MLNLIPNLLTIVFIFGLSFLSGCQKNFPAYIGDTTSLQGLQAMSNIKNTKANRGPKIGKIRELGLKEIALSLGAQAGLAYRANIIDQALSKQAHNLDAIYDFNSLVLEHNVLPPVLLEGRNTLNLAGTKSIRISDRTYKIAKQARFITTPPNWRQYLWMDYQQPEYPNKSLLPKTRHERNIWCDAVARGWKNGIDQANTILEESVARIKEDYTGMLLYRKLLAMNMVSPPFVSNTDLGVTGNESEMHIDDRVLRITALPSLNVNSKEWRAAVGPHEMAENSLKHFNDMAKLAENSEITVNDRTWKPIISPIN